MTIKNTKNTVIEIKLSPKQSADLQFAADRIGIGIADYVEQAIEDLCDQPMSEDAVDTLRQAGLL